MRDVIYSILKESIAKRAYHFTSNAEKIIRENRLKASIAITNQTDAEKNRGRIYFISLTRSGIDGYKAGTQKIVLDGEKLSQNYKGVPVDYWDIARNPKSWQEIKDHGSKGNLSIMRNAMEKEDRIVLNKPYIDNINKYIIEVHVNIDTWKNMSDGPHILKRLLHTCQKNNIPIYFYNNEDDFLKEKESARININDIFGDVPVSDSYMGYKQNDSDFYRYSTYNLITLLIYNDKENEKKIKNELFNLGPNDPWDDESLKKLNTEYQNYLKYINPWDIKNIYVQHVYAFLSALKIEKEEVQHFLLDLLKKDMDKYKSKSIEDYVMRKTGLEKVEPVQNHQYYFEDEDGYKHRNVHMNVRNWTSDISEIYKELPKYKWYDKKIIKAFNNQNMTLMALYNILVKEINRKKADQIFKNHFGLTVKKEEVYE